MTTCVSLLQAFALLVYSSIKDAEYFKETIQNVQKDIEKFSTNEAFDKALQVGADCENFFASWNSVDKVPLNLIKLFTLRCRGMSFFCDWF